MSQQAMRYRLTVEQQHVGLCEALVHCISNKQVSVTVSLIVCHLLKILQQYAFYLAISAKA